MQSALNLVYFSKQFVFSITYDRILFPKLQYKRGTKIQFGKMKECSMCVRCFLWLQQKLAYSPYSFRLKGNPFETPAYMYIHITATNTNTYILNHAFKLVPPYFFSHFMIKYLHTFIAKRMNFMHTHFMSFWNGELNGCLNTYI